MRRTSSNATWERLGKAISGQVIDFSGIDETEILETASSNGVSPLLDYRCKQGSAIGLGKEARGQLLENSKALASQDLVLCHDTQNLLNLLADNEVRCLLMKGAPLALLHYEKSYHRVRCDTDIYIPDSDYRRTAVLLENAGYTLHNLGRLKYSSKQFQASIHTFKLLSSTFDIHYRLSNRPLFQSTLRFEDCWEEKQAVPELGAAAWALSTRDLLIHACIHRIAHGRNTQRDRLIWLYDIHLLWQAMDNSEKQSFVEKALDKKIGALCANALEVCEGLFTPLERPESQSEEARLAREQDYLNKLNSNSEDEPSAKLIHASKPRWAWADLLALKGTKARIAFAKELLANKF